MSNEISIVSRRARVTFAALSLGALLGACTEPGEMTGVGAAAGGALGAGLGAIVGNQTGDSGTGLVVGALAGAGAGAAVGNALQAQDEAIRSQDEAIERQDLMIRAQRGEIEDLRRLSQDTVKFGDPAASAARGSSVRLNPPMKGRYGFQSRAAAPVPVRASGGVQENDIAPAKAFQSNETSESVTGAVPVVQASDSIRFRDSTEPVKPASGLEVADTKTSIESLPGSPIEPSAARPVPAADSSECQGAQEEFSRAQGKSEAPDKLFHLRRALRLCPNVAAYHVGLAEVYEGLGRTEDAQYEYGEALKLDPTLTEVKSKVATVKAPDRY